METPLIQEIFLLIQQALSHCCFRIQLWVSNVLPCFPRMVWFCNSWLSSRVNQYLSQAHLSFFDTPHKADIHHFVSALSSHTHPVIKSLILMKRVQGRSC